MQRGKFNHSYPGCGTRANAAKLGVATTMFDYFFATTLKVENPECVYLEVRITNKPAQKRTQHPVQKQAHIKLRN